MSAPGDCDALQRVSSVVHVPRFAGDRGRVRSAPLWAFVSQLALLLVFTMSCSQGDLVDSGTAASFANPPLRIDPCRTANIHVDASLMRRLKSYYIPRVRSKSGRRISVSQCLHCLRVNDRDAALLRVDGASLGPALNALMVSGGKASKTVFGAPHLLKTRHGARFRALGSIYPIRGKAQESHYAQTLAALGALGVPLNARLSCDGESIALAEVFADAIAYYDPKRRESIWAAMALIRYLPPRSSWCTRFGDEYSFDDLARAVVEPIRRSESCAGTHRLMAMVLLVRAASQRPILSRPRLGQVIARLRELLRRAELSQKASGSWGLQWYSEPEGARKKDARGGSLLATGHLLEAITFVPESIAISEVAIARASRWLISKLGEAKEEDVLKRFCPYAHAICAIDALRAASRD